MQHSPPTKPALPSTRKKGAVGDEKQPAPESDSVKVICRIRPFNARELELHQQSIEGKPDWERMPLRSVVEFEDRQCIFLDHEKDFSEKERFEFDSCLWSIPDQQQKGVNEFAGQDAIHNHFGKAVLQQAWKGYNTCFFAYGQTGSGKTYSMMGGDGTIVDPGLIPRICEELFAEIERKQAEGEAHRDSYFTTYKVEVRYLEIYNEMVKDLLWSLSTLPPETKGKVNPDNLKIRSSPATGVFVEHLTAVEVDGWQRMIDLISLGNSCRHVAATKMNERSSRSHAIFKVSLAQVTTNIPKKQFEKPTEHTRDSLINLVDLAGSERNKKTGATGERLKEASSINKSLTTLKMVIDVLVENAQHGTKRRPPYRDSHLTSLLMDSLGGNSKTFMLVCLSPHLDNAEETLQTLRYGSKARQIVNTVRVNENAAGRMMMELEDELERMKGELEKASSPEVVEALRQQINEHEVCIQGIETEVREQQERIQHLREEKDKEMKQRQAHAFANLHALAQARTRRDEAETEQQKLKRRLSTLRHDKESLEDRHETAERDQDALKQNIEEYKQQITDVEREIEVWKRKHSKLESYKRDLLKTVDEQQQELTSIKNQKISALLRARLQAARIRIEFSHQLEEQQEKHDEEIRVLTMQAQRTEEQTRADHRTRIASLESERAALQQQYNTAEDEFNKMDSEKSAQISQLEREVAQLQQENQEKSESNDVRLRLTTADWEKRFVAMETEMEQQYNTISEQWAIRHKEETEREEETFRLCEEEWNAELEATNKKWQDQIQHVTAEGERNASQAERVWNAKFEEKLALNESLRGELRSIEERENAYSDMLHRINAVMDTLPPVNSSSSTKYKRLVELMKEFQLEYETNRVSKYKLLQLQQANFSNARCGQAPLVGVEDSTNGTLSANTEQESSNVHTQRRAISPARLLRSARHRSPARQNQ